MGKKAQGVHAYIIYNNLEIKVDDLVSWEYQRPSSNFFVIVTENDDAHLDFNLRSWVYIIKYGLT